MNKKQLRTILEIIIECGGSYKLNYMLPEAYDTAEKCYDMYYGGGDVVEIYQKTFRIGGDYHDIETLEGTLDKIYKVLENDVNKEFHQAMENLGWENAYEVLKYFDRDEGKKDYVNLKAEIDRLVKEREYKMKLD